MRFKSVSTVVLLIAGFLFFGVSAYGQQTGLSGVVTDVQGGAIAGAKVEVKQTGGSTYYATTNGQGAYVIPSMNAAEYTIRASATNFATAEKKVLLLVGQLATVDLSLPIASASSTVVVEASNDLAIDTTSSSVAGNVTPTEVQDVPVNGRNYVELSALVPGIKSNSFGETPAASGQSSNAGDAETGKFQITLDGLQYSQDSVGSSFGQPHISQDAIAQFQIITNRFDATSGRSAGIYVNVQSKTGTNDIHGGGFLYARNSFFNSADPIIKYARAHFGSTANPTPDFADQQYGGTLGGAIMKDKLWYFGSYEGEHSPNTVPISTYVTNGVGSLYTHAAITKKNDYLGRIDFQPNTKNRFFLRGDGYTSKISFVAQGADPSQAYASSVNSAGYVADWNHNINDHLINDFHAGFHYFQFQNLPYFATNSIVLTLPAVTVGEPYNEPEIFSQFTQQYRDDLFWMKGKHSVRVGGEYLLTHHGGTFPQYLRGGLTTCSSSQVASPTLYNSFFPNGTLDPTTWRYDLINSYCNLGEIFTQAFGQYDITVNRNIIGVWAQDDWKILPRLTLNLGLRYDNDLGAYNTSYVPTPGLLTPNTNPNANFAPRLGFSYDPFGNGKTSIRGGAGLYFADQVANAIIDEELYSSTTRALQATLSGTNLNLPSPFAGQNPTTNPQNYVSSPQPVLRGAKTPYSAEASFGIARELGWKTTLTADAVYQRVYDDYIALSGNLLQSSSNPQQNLNPTAALTATVYGQRVCGNGGITLDTLSGNLGSAAPGGTVAKQVCNQLFGGSVRNFSTQPGAGVIAEGLNVGIKHATTFGFTGALAYTWGHVKNSTGGAFSYPNKPFIPGIQQEWANGTDDQRHTLTINGEYKWKYGLSLSGLYHFGSGLAFATTSGSTVNGYVGSTRTFAANVTPIAPGTTCPTAPCVVVYAPLSKIHYDAGYGYSVIARDAFRGTPYNRFDARVQESFKIWKRARAILAVESFNLTNHANFGNFATVATTGTGANAFGSATASSGAPFEYQARSFQFIGRVSF